MTQSYPEGLPPPQHRTVSVQETHHVGEDGLPGFHYVVQQIEALEPIRTFPYYFDTGEVGGIQGIKNCTTNDWRPATPELHMVDIILPTPLDAGQRTTVEYTTWFSYESSPPPEYRRRIGSFGMEALSITVRFEDELLPAKVWKAAWNGARPDDIVIPDSIVEVDLKPVPAEEGLPHTVETHRAESNLSPGTVLGFYWEWPA